MQIRIPTGLVRLAPVDYEEEVSQICGASLILSDGGRIRPLTAGTLMLLELVTSKLYMSPAEATPYDIAVAVVIINGSRSAVDWIADGTLQRRASDWLNRHDLTIPRDYDRIVKWIRVTPSNGFDMRPSQVASAGKPFLFDGAFAGSVLRTVARESATPLEYVKWRMSLCEVGHILAQYEASVSDKTASRPIDMEHLRQLSAESEARHMAGELDPWQMSDPFAYPLTHEQVEARPEVVEEYENAKAEWRKNHGRN